MRAPPFLFSVAALGLLTPLAAGADPYGATYKPDLLSCMTPGQSRVVNVLVTNTGTNTWTVGGPTPYRLSYHWYQGATPVIYDGVRTDLPQAVGSVNSALKNSVTLAATVTAPPALGSYSLRWDMVQETVVWFSTQGVGTFNQNVEVKASCPSIADLCLHVDCAGVLKPKIDRIVPFVSNSTPGGQLLIGGSRFGEATGTVWIRGLERWNGVGFGGNGDLQLQIETPPGEDLWKPGLILAKIPTNVAEVMDQRVRLQVRTSAGTASNEIELDFTAAKEARLLDFSDPAVHRVHCGIESTLDICNGWRDPDDDTAPIGDPLSLWEYHEECGQTIWGWHSSWWHGTDSDTDSYKIQLANGWTLAGFQWSATPSDEGEAGATQPGGFAEHASSWQVAVPYFVTYLDEICYGLNVFIVGPKGVPWS